MRILKSLGPWIAALLLSTVVFAQKDKAEKKVLDAALQAQFEQTLTKPAVETADWIELLRVVLVKDGESEALIAALEAAESAPGAQDERKFETRRALTFVLHREGRLADALKRCEAAIAITSTEELVLERAHLLDAQGKIDAALAAYADVQKKSQDKDTLNHVGLRVALLQAEKDDATTKTASTGSTSRSSGSTSAALVTSVAAVQAVPLSSLTGATPLSSTSASSAAVSGVATSIVSGFASTASSSADGTPTEPSAEDVPSALFLYATQPGREADLQNRAAVVLALLGRPREAIRLYQVSGEGSDRFRQEIRLAEWALTAKAWTEAQEHAWNARAAAALKRDRLYALTVLVEAHRSGKALDKLIDRFAAEPNLDAESRRTWIDLLRETSRVDEAMKLFKSSSEGGFTPEMRRELLDMCREAGRETELVATYEKLIEEEPDRVEWREGLSRYYLERGQRAEGEQVWKSYVAKHPDVTHLISAAGAARDLGLETLAQSCASRAAEDPAGVIQARLFLFDLEARNGHIAEAQNELEAFDKEVDAKAPERIQLAEAFERIGNKKRAVDILEGVRLQRGGDDAEEDLEMRLSWLLSEVGDEKRALERWQNLWHRVSSVPRRRQVEDRLMAVASRLGVLADIAVDIEQKLVDGKADDREAGLLVRLYQKVGDPVSAAEVLEEHLKKKGGTDIDVLKEKAHVYLGGKDYYHFEKTVKQLIELDPENKPDHLRQLAMSNLERGRPAEARVALSKLAECENPSDAAEFEAGVLALAGLNDDATKAYRRGLANHPERIDGFLLLANSMKALRQTDRAIGMFQQLAETAEKDDLFTIAIDGILNMRAKEPVLKWARRVTLERIARRHDKLYLYQLYTDLSEELNDQAGQVRALECSLAIAAEQRAAILRQLMEVTLGKADNSSYVIVNGVMQPRRKGGEDSHRLAYGRRLIGLEDLVPPQVFLELGEAFLRSGEVSNAAKTFSMARDVPDYASFRRQVAKSFEDAQYAENALEVYERAMASEALDASLLLKAGELHEQLGRDERACELYTRAMDVLLSQHALSGATDKKSKEDEPYSYLPRNVGDFEKYFGALQSGFLATATPAAMQAFLDAQTRAFEADLKELDALPNSEGDARKIASCPRLMYRASFLRFVGLRTDRLVACEAVDLELLKRFPGDESLLEAVCTERAARGYVDAAAKLVSKSTIPEKSRDKMLARLGRSSGGVQQGQLKLADVVSRLVPILIEGDPKKASLLLRSAQLGATSKDDLPYVQLLCSAALYVRDESSVNGLTNYAIRAIVEHSQSYEERQRIPTLLEKARKVISPEAYDVLVDSFVTLVSDKDAKLQEYQYMLQEIQEKRGKPLLSADVLKKRVEACVPDNAWMLSTLIGLVPVEQRLGLLRPVWTRIPASERADIALGLLAPQNETVSGDFADFLVEAFEESVEGVDEPRMVVYAVQNLVENDKVAPAISQRVLDRVLKKWSDLGSFLCLDASVHLKKGDVEGAFTAFRAALTAGPKDDNDWSFRNSVQNFANGCGREHAQQLLLELDRYEADKGATPPEDAENDWNDPIFTARSTAFALLGDQDKKRELLESKLARKPNDVRALNDLWQDALQRGDVARQIELLERLAAVDKRAPYRRASLVNVWMGQRNPIRALETKKVGEAKKDDAEKTPEGKKLDVASIDAVKKAVDAGQPDVARSTYRRTWRQFSREGRNFGYVSYGGWYGGDPQWPDKARNEEKKAVKPWRGGLESYHLDESAEELEAKAKARSKSAKTAYDGIADQAFGEDELLRQVRLLDDQALQRSRSVLRALQRAEVGRLGADQALAGWKQRLDGAQASTIDRALMLSYFEDHQADLGERDRAMLAELASAVHPLDGAQLRALARLNASIGDTAHATSIYKWLATLATGRRWFYGNESAISTGELLTEVTEQLKGADAESALEAILRSADPGDDEYERDAHDALVISTWAKNQPLAQALARTQDVVSRVTDTKQGLRREAALQAACLLASAGETDRALAAFDVACAKLDAASVKLDARTARWQKDQLEPRQLGFEQIRALFQKGLGAGVDAAAWYTRLAEHALVLDAAKRLDPDTTRDVLLAACVRLHELGDDARASTFFEELDKRSTRSASQQLVVLDLARLFGREERALAIENELLKTRSLPWGRIPEVAARVTATQGEAAAFELEERAAEFCLDPTVTEPLIALAAKLGKTERVEFWTKQRDAAKSAAAELEMTW